MGTVEMIKPGDAVAFVGTGVMGRSMARNLMDAGYVIHVHTRTKARAAELLDAGATWHDTPGSAAAAARATITIVGFPADVESVYFDPDTGILAHASEADLLIDMTTSRPDLAARIAVNAEKVHGAHGLDAPVSGGDIGAKAGTLSIMVGADPAAFEAARPLFEVMGQTVVLQGGPGSGQHTKMCNQIAVAAGMLGAAEAMAYAGNAGLDPHVVLQSIASGAAGSWALSNLAGRMVEHDYAPGFYVKHFIKDMGIAIESAEAMGLELPGLATAKTMYEQLVARGCEDEGTQALFRMYIIDPTVM